MRYESFHFKGCLAPSVACPREPAAGSSRTASSWPSKARREPSPAPSAYSRVLHLFSDVAGDSSGSRDSLDADTSAECAAAACHESESQCADTLTRKSRTEMSARLFGLLFGERVPSASASASPSPSVLRAAAAPAPLQSTRTFCFYPYTRTYMNQLIIGIVSHRQTMCDCAPCTRNKLTIIGLEAHLDFCPVIATYGVVHSS